jgi:hypothetical protein
MWTEEIVDTMKEFQPGKIFPVQKRAFVAEDGARVGAAGRMHYQLAARAGMWNWS